MTSKSFAGYVLLPILMFVAYFVCLASFPQFTKGYLHTEHGGIEWGTALTFLCAAAIAARLTWRSHNKAPMHCRVLYGLFAVAGLVVALEEVSYGQKLFDWSSPAWFAEYNSKGETNLHNTLGNRPSDLLRSFASVGFPLCCGIIPLWLHLRGKTPRTDSRVFFLLPQLELVTISALTIVLSIFNKVPSIRGMANWSGHLGEFKELYWGVAAVCYASIISRRLATTQSPQMQRPIPMQSTHREAA